MGAKRNLVLGRCAAVLFLCGAIASLPTNLLLKASAESYWIDLLALVSAAICLAIPWDRISRHWLHVLGVVATLEVVVALMAHREHALVFQWYFVLVAVFAGYAFRRRVEAVAQVGFAVLGMVVSALYASPVEPDAVANMIVGAPTLIMAAGVVVWLRENLERRERTDPLTGLGNRRALMEALEEIADGRRLRQLVMFDLDGFKRYNDRLGHAAGDQLLELFGRRLSTAVEGRGEAFRLGGDELCVLLEDSGALPDCVAALDHDGVGASHGSAWLPREADTPSAALSLADTRMYTAKRAAKAAPFVLAMGSPTESPSRPSDPLAPRAR